MPVAGALVFCLSCTGQTHVAPAEPASASEVDLAHQRAQVDELVERLSPRLSRSLEGLHVQTHPDGRRSVDFEGRFQHAAVGRLDEDGVVRSVCVDSAEGLEAALKPR